MPRTKKKVEQARPARSSQRGKQKRDKEIIEISSDSESDYEEYLKRIDDGKSQTDQEIPAAQPGLVKDTEVTARTEAAQEKDVSREHSQSPTMTKQNLPVRVKASEAAEGKRSVEIEIPIPAHPAAHPSVSSAQVAKEVLARTPERPGHMRLDEDGAVEAFYTPLEAPATHPLDVANAAKLPPTPEVKDDDEEDSADDEEPPEAVSTLAAAADHVEEQKKARRAIDR
jgi:hypothetical protein